MKILLQTFALTILLMSTTFETPIFYNFKIATLDGNEFDFHTLKGKKVLIVNLASYCGYTSQYKELQQLSEQYKAKLVVLGFPSNSFFQEPKSNDSIKSFCQKNYGVTFPVFEKINVTGKNQHPLYQWLSKKEMNGWNDQSPSWNFNKYLVDENGKLLKYFGSNTKPLSKEILDLL